MVGLSGRQFERLKIRKHFQQNTRPARIIGSVEVGHGVPPRDHAMSLTNRNTPAVPRQGNRQTRRKRFGEFGEGRKFKKSGGGGGGQGGSGVVYFSIDQNWPQVTNYGAVCFENLLK